MADATETGLWAAALGVVITFFGTVLGMHRRYVTRAECETCQRHHNDDLSEIKRTNRIQFRMLRALVVHSSMPAEKKEALINDRGDQEDK
jgi:molybdopterin synthase catalytic subunit